MLLQNMRGEAIGIECRGALGVRQNVNLAMGLLERLTHLAILQPAAPAQDRLNARMNGVPEARRSFQLDLVAVPTHQATLVPDRRCARGKFPYELSRQIADQRMVD